MSTSPHTSAGIPALVLTAGLATRLRPLSLLRAKAALPVAGLSLASRLLVHLRDNGVTHAVLNLHHRPESLTALLGDGQGLGLSVRYSWEVPVLGSAGGPKQAIPLLGAPTFLIVNGDTPNDLALAPLVEHHRATGALVTMAVVPNTQPTRYGGAVVDNNGAITGFVSRGSTTPSWHFFGVQVVEARAFDRVAPDVPSETVGALYPALIAERPGSVVAYRSTANWLDIGTPADYLSTCLSLASGPSSAALWGRDAHVDETAGLDRTVLWDDVTIGARAQLSGCVVCDGVRVPPDTIWRDATIRRADDTVLPSETRIGDLAIGAIHALPGKRTEEATR